MKTNKHVITLIDASALTSAFQRKAPTSQPIAGYFN